ncbi:MAG: phasin family protein, partial [Pseudomonadota bacterium]
MATAKNTAKKVDTIVEDAQKAANDQFEKMTKGFEDVAAFGQDNMDALMKSSNLAVKAAEEMNAEVMSFAKKSVEESVAAAKELTSVKTAPEFFEKGAELAKVQFDGFVQQA